MPDLVPLVGVLIPIAFFAMIAAIFILPAYFKSRERRNLQDTLRVAIEKGQELPPEVINALTTDAKRPPSRLRDLRNAVIWLAIAGALVAIGVIRAFDEGDMSDAYGWFAAACLPGFIGLAFLGFAALNKERA